MALSFSLHRLRKPLIPKILSKVGGFKIYFTVYIEEFYTDYTAEEFISG
jgi:hypothetical protein